MTNIGIILIFVVVALYAVWIWYTKSQKGARAGESNGVENFYITVKGVYSPAVIRAKFGKPIKINFIREESNECSQFVNFPDFKIRKELPEGETVAIEIKPSVKGEFLFTCDMSMYQGKLIVE